MLNVNWHPSLREIRRFAFVWTSAIFALSIILHFRHHGDAARFLMGFSLSIGLLSWAVPCVGRWVYRLWMGLSTGISLAVSYLALSLLFWLVLTPTGLLFRILGRDVLRLKRPKAESYWQTHEKINDTTAYRHLF